MEITKKVMREVEIIDNDKIKVGDKLRIKYIGKDVGYHDWFEIEVLKVNENYITNKLNGNIIDTTLDELKNYEIERVEESKLSKFTVGDRYKIEDKLSGDTYNAEVISVGSDMVLKRDSGKHTIVQESQIGNVLLFTKLNNTENSIDVNIVNQSSETNKDELSKEECEKKTEEYGEHIHDAYLNSVKILEDLFSRRACSNLRRY